MSSGCYAAMLPPAAVSHSGLHAKVLLKPAHCIRPSSVFCDYGLFLSAGSWHLRQQPSGCSPAHPTVERWLRLGCRQHLTPYCQWLNVFTCRMCTVQSPGLADCALKIGITSIPAWVKPDVTRDAAIASYIAAHYEYGVRNCWQLRSVLVSFCGTWARLYARTFS